MRFLTKVLPLLALSSISGFADTISTEASSPGFQAISAADLSPATTFTAAMTGALISSDSLELGVTPPAGTTLAQWGGVRRASVQPTSGRARPITSPTIPISEPVPNPTSGSDPVAVPEPGTFLTGVVLLGFCASSRNRRRK